MSLSNAQYDEIMREYEEKRNRTRYLQNEHLQEVYELIPEYRVLAEKIADVALESANRVLSGEKDALLSMKDEMNRISERQKALLRDFAFPEDYLEPVYTCGDCKDTGYIDNRKCHCLKQKILKVLYRQSNIESVLDRENFDTLSMEYYTDEEAEKMQPIIDTCRKFVKDFDGKHENVLLYGNVGVGKTFLTNCMAKALLDEGHSVIYFTAIQLFDTLSKYVFKRDGYDEESHESYNDIFECDLLIIDDLGTENVNSFVVSQLFEVLNERDMREKSTIISTNLTLKMILERYSERNFSRIFGKYTVLKPDIEDIRIRKKRTGES